MTNFGDKVSFIWSVADLLRGPFKPAQYGRVILPLTVLRRLDCVLEPTKEKVLANAAELKGGKITNAEPILNRVAKASFHNTSKLRGRSSFQSASPVSQPGERLPDSNSNPGAPGLIPAHRDSLKNWSNLKTGSEIVRSCLRHFLVHGFHEKYDRWRRQSHP